MTSRAFHDVAHKNADFQISKVIVEGCPHVKPVIDPLK
jgi:hypothetical protein